MTSGPHRRVAYGRVLLSELDLPELDAAPPGADVEIRILSGEREAVPEADPAQFPHAFLVSNEPWLRYRAERSGHVLLFPGKSWFFVAEGGRTIHVHPGFDLPDLDLRHQLLDQVIPLALGLDLEPVLHASAVVTPWGAVGFLGRSGRGKSTTALHLARQACYPLLSDDALVLRRGPRDVLAVPSYPTVRLWPDTAGPLLSDLIPDAGREEQGEPKQRLRLPKQVAFQRTPHPLRALLLLHRDEEGGQVPSIAPMSGPEAAVVLLEHAYRLELFGQSRAPADFLWQTDLAERLSMAHLTLPDDLSGLMALPSVLQRYLTQLKDR